MKITTLSIDKRLNRLYDAFVVQENRTLEPAATLQEWMERTGTNGRQLLALLRERGERMSEGHLSNILKGSRRCSLRKAIILNEITGVPIKNIAQWPKVREPRTSGAAA